MCRQECLRIATPMYLQFEELPGRPGHFVSVGPYTGEVRVDPRPLRVRKATGVDDPIRQLEISIKNRQIAPIDLAAYILGIDPWRYRT